MRKLPALTGMSKWVVWTMNLSKDVFSQGTRARVHRLMQLKVAPQRVLDVAFGRAGAQFMVLGGAVVAPILSAIGWVGLVLPPGTALHHASAGLLACAMIALGTALIGAHNSRDAVHTPDESPVHSSFAAHV